MLCKFSAMAQQRTRLLSCAALTAELASGRWLVKPFGSFLATNHWPLATMRRSARQENGIDFLAAMVYAVGNLSGVRKSDLLGKPATVCAFIIRSRSQHAIGMCATGFPS